MMSASPSTNTAAVPLPPIRIGFLSTAAVTRHLISVLDGMTEPKCAIILAVSSRSPEKAEAFAVANKIPRWCPSHEELLTDKDIDAVYIPLPNELHAEWIIKSLEAGKHVLCEKPLCLTVEQVLQVKDAQQRMSNRFGQRLVVMEAIMSLYTAQAALVKQLVTGGVLGEIQYMRGVSQYAIARQSHRQGSIETGGGSLWDVGCYPIYYARYLLEADPVRCVGFASWATHACSPVDSTEEAASASTHTGEEKRKQELSDLTFSGTLMFPAWKHAPYRRRFSRDDIAAAGSNSGGEASDASFSSPAPYIAPTMSPARGEAVTLEVQQQPPKIQRFIPLQITSSFLAPLETSFELHGTSGSLWISNPYKPGPSDVVTLRKMDMTIESFRTTTSSNETHKHPYEGELVTFCQAVHAASSSSALRAGVSDDDGTTGIELESSLSDPASVHFSLGNVKAITALLRSAVSGNTEVV